MTRAEAVKLRSIVEQASSALDDRTASEAPALFPRMKHDGSLIKAGTRVNWQGTIKQAVVDLWDTQENTPECAGALWQDIAYRDGVRIIPEIITAAEAFSMEEVGWWNGAKYESAMDGNVYTPDEYPAGWLLLIV